MSAGVYSFLVEQGSTISKFFTNYDINGNLIPFIAGTFTTFAIKATTDINAANIILARSNDGRLSLNESAGQITLTLSSNDSENVLGAGNFVYDIFVYFPSGSIQKFLTGSITVEPSVIHV